MKPRIRTSLLTLGLVLGLSAVSLSQAQTPTQTTAAINPVDLQVAISNAVANINTNGVFFTPGEVELRLGAAYSQKTGEAGTLVAAEKWDVFGATGVGVGAEGITSGQNQAAEFAYLAYRKTYGNIAGVGYVGGGYNELDKCPMGVVGGRVEWRPSAHLGTWVGAGYGIEAKQQNARGMIVSAGVGYAF